MSCTVVAIPLALQWVYGAIFAAEVITIAGAGYAIEKKQSDMINNYGVESCNDIHVISENKFTEKTFETPFKDKDLLIKTLEEHGVKNIQESEWGSITGINGAYELKFERNSKNAAFDLTIKHLVTDNAEEKFKNLNSEYAINVQEASYNQIIDRLKDNNLEIENEEILDDNTIVLTINLE